MAKINNFILCEDIQNQIILQSENGIPTLQPNIVSPLTVIAPVSVPGNYSFAMFGIMSGFDKEATNEMVISILDPNGKECFATAGIQIPPVPGNNIDNFNFSINLRNFVFRTEGSYEIVIKLNREVCFKTCFDVKAKGV